MQSNNVKADAVDNSNPKKTSIKCFDSDVNEMHSALTAITREIQRFYSSDQPLPNHSEDIRYLNKIDIFKSRLQKKKRQIKRLKKNVKICWMKLLIISSKDKEAGDKRKSFLRERERDFNSLQNHVLNFGLIRQLCKQNGLFEERIKHIKNYINKSYDDLQKKTIQPSCNDKLPLLDKLKTIINSNAKQNIDVCIEREKCHLLEQKNRFLKNKINILVYNIESLKEELASVTFQLSKRDKEILFYKNKLLNKINHINVSAIENPLKVSNLAVSSSSAHATLSSHLSLVKSLLIDQNRMIHNLKNNCDLIISFKK